MQLKRTNNKKSYASVMNKYAAIQERSYTDDFKGGSTETWTDIPGYSSVPMAIEPITALRKEEYRSYNVEATHYIKIRFYAVLDEKNNRVLYNGRSFKFLSIENIQEKGVVYFILAKEYR